MANSCDDKYYFVSYINQRHGNTVAESNVILKNVHPLVWASMPPTAYVETDYITYVRFWAEIDAEVALNPDVQRYINFETAQDKQQEK